MNKPLPHNTDAERAILAAILLDNSIIGQALDVFTPNEVEPKPENYFFLDSHRLIFRAMRALHASARAIDPITLLDVLQTNGDSMNVGGAAFVAALIDGVPRSLNIRDHCDIVFTKWAARQRMLLTNAAFARIADDDFEADDTSYMLQKNLAVIDNCVALNLHAEDSDKKERKQHIFDIGDCAESIIAYRQERLKQIVSTTGWEEMDELYRPVKPAFTVITGQPNHGKSSWLDNLITNIHIRQQWKFAIISFETLPIALHQLMILSLIKCAPYSLNIENHLSDDEIRKGCEELAGHFVFHHVPEERRTVRGVLNFAKDTIESHGIDGLVFDPWAELQPPTRLAAGITEFVQGGLMEMRSFAYENNLHSWLVAHPSKLPVEARGGGKNKQPHICTLEDISGSKHFENKADYGITVHRHNRGTAMDYTEVFVNKVRRGFPGRVGSQAFDYNTFTGGYTVRDQILTSNNHDDDDY